MTTLTELRQRAEAIVHEDWCYVNQLKAKYQLATKRHFPITLRSSCSCPRAALLEAVAGVERKLRENTERAERLAQMMEQGAGEVNPGDRLRQANRYFLALLGDEE